MNRLHSIFASPDLSDFMAKRYEDVPKRPDECHCGAKHVPDSGYGGWTKCRRCGNLKDPRQS